MRPNVLVVGPARDFRRRPYDGLTTRHQRLIAALSECATVSVVALLDVPLRPGSSSWALQPAAVLSLPTPYSMSRSARLRRLALHRPGRPPSAWSNELCRLAAVDEPDVVVTFGPWLDEELSPLFARWRCVHVFDEELSRMPDLAPQSSQARLLRSAELAVRRRRLPVPDTVVVISEREVGHAKRRYGSAPKIVVIPQTLPVSEWTQHPDRSDGDAIIAIGNFREGRNADALADLLVHLDARDDRPENMSLVVVSGTGFAPELTAAAASQRWVELVAGTDEPSQLYRRSRLALAPAGRATGFKATILQAWLSGTPVVASAASAATIEERNVKAVAVARSPEEMARVIVSLWEDEPALERLAEAGRVAARRDHHDDQALKEWRELVLSAAALDHPVEGGERTTCDGSNS
jgi:glycosyltransferase involved in cell wall biosynthesis